MDTVTYISSLILFFIKGEISGDRNFIKLRIPNAFYSTVPFGYSEESIPMTHISSASTRLDIRFFKLLIGTLITFFSLKGLIIWIFSDLGSTILMFLFIILGITLMDTSLGAYMTITLTSGVVYNLRFAITQKKIADDVCKNITSLIAQRMDDTNTRVQTETLIHENSNNTKAIIDAVNNLKK